MHLHSTLFLAGLTACGAGPRLMAPAPLPLASFSLTDSAEVVRRVQQVFSCTAAPNTRSFGTLGWRRSDTFVDVTLMQLLPPAGSAPAPDRMCYKGFRIDAAGRIFALPVKEWPYTAFQKRPHTVPTS